MSCEFTAYAHGHVHRMPYAFAAYAHGHAPGIILRLFLFDSRSIRMRMERFCNRRAFGIRSKCASCSHVGIRLTCASGIPCECASRSRIDVRQKMRMRMACAAHFFSHWDGDHIIQLILVIYMDPRGNFVDLHKFHEKLTFRIFARCVIYVVHVEM